MWPWGHLAVAYLLYAGFARRRYGRPPRAVPAVALAIGSQFPDLIDKPFAWTLGVLPGGRTLTHSLAFAALVVPAVCALALRLERLDVGLAFALGHLSHLLADVHPSILAGDLEGATFLLWPIVEPPSYESVDSILEAILTYYAMGPYEWLQLLLFAVAAAVWYRDGAPGLEYPRLALGRLASLAR